MPLSLRRTTVAGAAALALFSLSACGGGDKPSSSASHSASSGASASGDSASTGTGSALSKKLTKVFDDGGSAHVAIDMGDQGSGSGDMDFSGDAPSVDLTISGGQAGSAELRLVSGTMYIKSAQIPGGKWVKVDENAAGAIGFNPATLVDQLKTMKGGTDLGDGHWKVDEGNGITADVYFDGDTLKKISVSGASSKPIVTTYSDWGKKVDVKAPPASDVIEMPNVQAPSVPSLSASPQ